MATFFITTAVASHAGLLLLASPAAPLGVALLLVCTPAALASGIAATR